MTLNKKADIDPIMKLRFLAQYKSAYDPDEGSKSTSSWIVREITKYEPAPQVM